MASSIVGNAEKRSGSCSVSSSNGMPVLNESYSYTVRSDDKEATRISILYDTPNLPRVGQTFSAYGQAICKNVNATRRENNPYYWDVTCTFSSEVDEGQDQQDPNSAPEEWVPIRETKFERLQENVSRDKDGTVIANSAGQPFQSGLTISRFIPIWEFWQFEPATVTDEILIARNETINSTSFKGKAAKTLLLTIMSSKVGFYYGNRRRLTQYSLKYNKRTWTHRRADVGTVYVESGQRKPYLDDDERTVILGGLDGFGAKVAVGSPPTLLEFDIYDESDFSFLRI